MCTALLIHFEPAQGAREGNCPPIWDFGKGGHRATRNANHRYFNRHL